METLTPDELAYRTVLLAADPPIREAPQCAADFGAMVRTRDHLALAGWFERAESSGQPEIRSFAAGIRRDRSAVEAALRSPWSNEHVAYCTPWLELRPVSVTQHARCRGA